MSGVLTSAVSGAPSLYSGLTSGINTGLILASDAASIAQSFGPPQWGIFDNQTLQPLLTADTVLALEYKRDFRISDFPVESGSFATYNKVISPFDISISLAFSGTLSLLQSVLSGGAVGAVISQFATGTDQQTTNRRNFLNAMELQVASLSLCKIVTPEQTYSNCTMTHYDYRRETKRGATLIVVDVQLREVRVAAAPAFSNVSNPASSAQQNSGAVQPQTAPAVAGLQMPQ